MQTKWQKSTQVMASAWALKALKTELYASCSSWWIWVSISVSPYILEYGMEPTTADLPFPATRPPLGILFWCGGGRSSSVPAIILEWDMWIDPWDVGGKSIRTSIRDRKESKTDWLIWLNDWNGKVQHTHRWRQLMSVDSLSVCLLSLSIGWQSVFLSPTNLGVICQKNTLTMLCQLLLKAYNEKIQYIPVCTEATFIRLQILINAFIKLWRIRHPVQKGNLPVYPKFWIRF